MIYLDNAATSKFKPKEVVKAVHGALLNSANPGRSSHRDAVTSAISAEPLTYPTAKGFSASASVP